MKEQRPYPEFVKIDPEQIERDLIQRYEQKTGKTLYPAQIEHLFVNQVAYALTRGLSAIQHASQQMLVDYSEAPIIDYLADLVGVKRLSAKPASTRLKFSLKQPEAADVAIPAFTLVSDASGNVQFMTLDPVTIHVGQQEVETEAYCCDVGTKSNGIARGKLNQLVGHHAVALQVENLTPTSGGYDDESTESLRKRIKLAPESYSNAGSYGAYEFHTRSVHQSIVDVAVLGANKNAQVLPGSVEIYPLTTEGMPSAELLNKIQSYLSDEKVRPLCDTVIVKAPHQVNYTIRAKLVLKRNFDKQMVLANAKLQLDNWLAAGLNRLGLDIVPHQIKVALSVEGVYDVILLEPTELTVLTRDQWSNCVAIHLEIGGVTDE